jgi:hypothetical protein
MAGAYCKFCDERCFVLRVMPDDARWRPGQAVHLATCARGAAYDRANSGYDHTTAINPAAEPATVLGGQDGVHSDMEAIDLPVISRRYGDSVRAFLLLPNTRVEELPVWIVDLIRDQVPEGYRMWGVVGVRAGSDGGMLDLVLRGDVAEHDAAAVEAII